MFSGGENFERFFHDSAIPMHLIEEGLYLGSLDAAKDLNLLRQHNITRVLSLLDTFRYFSPYEGIEQMRIEIADSPSARIIDHVPSGIRFISESQKSGQNILVHCAAGVSRSASMVIAYIMVKHSLDFESAKNFVKSKRGCIWPNNGFQQQISSINVEAYRQYLN